MKKIILAVLMVLIIATPCMSDFNFVMKFTIEKTLWKYDTDSPEKKYEAIGFHEGKVYWTIFLPQTLEVICDPYLISEGEIAFYINFQLFSIAYIQSKEPDKNIFMYFLPYLSIGWQLECTDSIPSLCQIYVMEYSYMGWGPSLCDPY